MHYRTWETLLIERGASGKGARRRGFRECCFLFLSPLQLPEYSTNSLLVLHYLHSSASTSASFAPAESSFSGSSLSPATMSPSSRDSSLGDVDINTLYPIPSMFQPTSSTTTSRRAPAFWPTPKFREHRGMRWLVNIALGLAIGAFYLVSSLSLYVELLADLSRL